MTKFMPDDKALPVKTLTTLVGKVKAARMLGVTRQTVVNWCANEEAGRPMSRLARMELREVLAKIRDRVDRALLMLQE